MKRNSRKESEEMNLAGNGDQGFGRQDDGRITGEDGGANPTEFPVDPNLSSGPSQLALTALGGEPRQPLDPRRRHPMFIGGSDDEDEDADGDIDEDFQPQVAASASEITVGSHQLTITDAASYQVARTEPLGGARATVPAAHQTAERRRQNVARLMEASMSLANHVDPDTSQAVTAVRSGRFPMRAWEMAAWEILVGFISKTILSLVNNKSISWRLREPTTVQRWLLITTSLSNASSLSTNVWMR